MRRTPRRLDRGDYDKAIGCYTDAIELNPKGWWYYVCRGRAWQHKGEYGKAIAEFDKVLLDEPEEVNALNYRAWLRATCPDAKYRDGAKALLDAQKAADIHFFEEESNLDTLAAVYAELGQFDEAIVHQERAIELETDEYWLKVYRSHLKFYKTGKPYREEPKK